MKDDDIIKFILSVLGTAFALFLMWCLMYAANHI